MCFFTSGWLSDYVTQPDTEFPLCRYCVYDSGTGDRIYHVSHTYTHTHTSPTMSGSWLLQRQAFQTVNSFGETGGGIVMTRD
jgi:hypothetical protein